MTTATPARSGPLRAPDGRFDLQPGAPATGRPARLSGLRGEDSPAWDLKQIQIRILDVYADGVPRHELHRELDLTPSAVKELLRDASRILGTGDGVAMVAECYLAGVFAPNPAGGDVPDVGAHRLPLLPLAVRGSSYADIADELGVSEDVVKFQLPAVYRIVGARGRVHLPRRLVDVGLLTAGLELAVPVPASPRRSRSALAKPAVTRRPRREPVPEPEPVVANPLSPVEFRVLRMLAFGGDVRWVANRLSASEMSVRESAQSAVAALGAKTLPHAVLLACQAGILPGGGS